MKHALFALLALLAVPALAFTVDVPLESKAQEARAKALFHQFRCVVCQSESVADSPADIAKDMRRTIREYVKAGKSDAEITQLLVQSYGEFVLMQPRFAASNLLLWLLPLLALVLGGIIASRQCLKR